MEFAAKAEKKKKKKKKYDWFWKYFYLALQIDTMNGKKKPCGEMGRETF